MPDCFKRIISRSNSSATHYLVIGIAAELFGVPTRQIQEVICLGDLDPMPSLPKRFTGPTRLIGKVVSLVKLPAPFIRPPDEFEVTPRTCVLVLKAHSSISLSIPKGLVVDRVESIIELGPDDVETITTRRQSAYTLGFAKRHLPVVLIDLQELIQSQSVQNATGSFRTNETATSRLKRRLQN